MKSRVFSIVVLVVCVALVTGFARSGNAVCVEEGQEAPDFTISDIDGNSVTLSAYRGKVVLLAFWAS